MSLLSVKEYKLYSNFLNTLAKNLNKFYYSKLNETFKYNEDGSRVGLLEDKQVYLVITSGGTKINSEDDFLTPWLSHVLNFFGIKNIDIIAADQLAIDYEKSIKQAEKQIENIN